MDERETYLPKVKEGIFEPIWKEWQENPGDKYLENLIGRMRDQNEIVANLIKLIASSCEAGNSVGKLVDEIGDDKTGNLVMVVDRESRKRNYKIVDRVIDEITKLDPIVGRTSRILAERNYMKINVLLAAGFTYRLLESQAEANALDKQFGFDDGD